MATDNAIALYQAQVERLHNEVIHAAIATDGGKGGELGKRHKGLFYHQWVGRYKAAMESLAHTKAGTNPLARILEAATNG